MRPAASICEFFRQAGQRNGTSIQDDKDSNTIVSVVSPVLTDTFSVGQLIMILAIACLPTRKHQECSILRIIPRRPAAGTPTFFAFNVGENPGWLWHQPGFPVRYRLKRGKPKEPSGTRTR